MYLMPGMTRRSEPGLLPFEMTVPTRRLKPGGRPPDITVYKDIRSHRHVGVLTVDGAHVICKRSTAEQAQHAAEQFYFYHQGKDQSCQ